MINESFALLGCILFAVSLRVVVESKYSIIAMVIDIVIIVAAFALFNLNDVSKSNIFVEVNSEIVLARDEFSSRYQSYPTVQKGKVIP
jgi:hypothetical protein